MATTLVRGAAEHALNLLYPEPLDAALTDPVAFLRDHVEIEDPTGAVIPLELWAFQEDTVRLLHEERQLIVLKARRLGLSWIVLAYALWLAITQQGIRVLILCKTGDDAAELLDRIRRMRDRIAAGPSAHLLAGLHAPAKVRDAVQTLDVGASTIKALMGTPAAARSETAGLVILDEFAFQRGAGEIWRAILPTIEGGGRIAVVSTGNGSEQAGGLGAEFAKQWARAVAGLSNVQARFFPWSARPDRDEAWKQRTLDDLGDEERFRTEYPEEPADAFLAPDTDLVYDTTHIAAACRLGDQLAALPRGERPNGPVWHGIDWGEHTHMLFARRLPGGGLWVFGELIDTSGDTDTTVEKVAAFLTEHAETIEFERFDAAEPRVHRDYRNAAARTIGYSPRWLAIPFSKYKQVAIRYARLLLRRGVEEEGQRVLAISGCPELVRQLATLEWSDREAGKVDKGDDHGPDALLTLVAELAYMHYSRDTREG